MTWLEQLIKIKGYSKLEFAKKLGYKCRQPIKRLCNDPKELTYNQKVILQRLFKIKIETIEQLIQNKLTINQFLKKHD